MRLFALIQQEHTHVPLVQCCTSYRMVHLNVFIRLLKKTLGKYASFGDVDFDKMCGISIRLNKKQKLCA